MFQIKWLQEASAEQIEILEFWIEHNQSTEYSRKIYDETKRQEELLKTYPYMGKVTRFQNTRRLLILNRFLLFYKVDEDKNTIYIISFWDGIQDPKKLRF